MRKVLLGGVALMLLGTAGYAVLATQGVLRNGSTSVAAKPTAVAKQIDPNQHDTLDVEYAKKKLLHHQLAVILADKAKSDATKPEVRELAARISVQETERASIYATLLKNWGEPYFNITDFPEVNGCHGYPTSSGMLPYKEVGDYRYLNGEAVDKTFFNIMTAHHNGNRELAKVEGKYLGYGKLIELRDESSREYEAEIEQLASTRDSLGL